MGGGGGRGFSEARARMLFPSMYVLLCLAHSCSSGWTGVVEVEAHVVTIRNAAGTDDAGLLNPLLKRWQDQACSQMVFGLPAVQSVINFKWDRYINVTLA